jgi:succinyl-CoA synthetase beta subunit
VIRLGGNREEKAIEILTGLTKDLPAPVECYGKDDSAEFCARRLRQLVDGFDPRDTEPEPARGPSKEPYSFETLTGNLEIDHALCRDCREKPCVEACIVDILKFEDGLPVLAISREDAARGKCIECLWCEQECRYGGGKGAIEITLPIEGLEE